MADLFDKFDSIIKVKKKLENNDPFKVCMDEVLSQTEATINGKPAILAGTNNYMGMTFDPACLAAAHTALDKMGTGTTGSRVLNGTYAGHRELERTLAEFYGMSGAIVFSTGYQANLGMLSTLAGPKDFILIDADCHASIYDGCRMGDATIIRFRHNDPNDLDKRLGRIDPDAGRLIVVEGLYSMLGDKAPLAEIARVKRKHGATLLVDEAHSMGVFGKTGRGVAQETGVEADIDFIVGTFSKSVGTIGGFCVSNHPKFDILRLVCRPYVFTASLPPSVVATAIHSISKIRDTPELREKLWRNAKQLHSGLSKLGFTLGAPVSPVCAVTIPEQDLAVAFWASLLDSGVYVNLAFPPATPQGMYLLRCSLSAAHTEKQIATILDRFEKFGRELDVIGPVTAVPRMSAASIMRSGV